MFRPLIAAVAASAIALVIVTASLGGSTAAPALRGSVGPGFTIKLTKAGKAVKALRSGTYRLTVSDRSAEHNFVLEREHGAERVVTSVGFVGTKTVTVKLTKGVWKVYCDPHAAVMVARFSVGGASVLPTRATTTGADDHGVHAEPGDDKGVHAEPGDDNGAQGEPEPGDDHGGR